MKKYIVVGLLIMSFILTPVFVSAQTSQPDQIATLIRLLQSLVQLLQQQLSMLQGGQQLQPLSSSKTITILSPNGGENWAVGSSREVRWTSTGVSMLATVGISIRRFNDISNGNSLYLASVANDGNENIVIPNWIMPGSYYLMVHFYSQGSDIYDFSGEPINIVSDGPIRTIVDSNPTSGAIDARDTSGSGFDRVDLGFSADVAGVTRDYFVIRSSNVGGAPSVANVLTCVDIQHCDEIANGVGLIFSRPLIAGERITVIHKPSSSSICLGDLPGDVNGDGVTNSVDISVLNAVIAGTSGKVYPSYSTDINRDSITDSKDAARWDELSSIWFGKRLPACPSSADSRG